MEQTTPPLMALAAAAKADADSKDYLQDMLKYLVSTNTLVKDDRDLLKKKRDLIVELFRASNNFAMPQEAKTLPLAKALALIRNSYPPSLSLPVEGGGQSASGTNHIALAAAPASGTNRMQININARTINRKLWSYQKEFTSLRNELSYLDFIVSEELQKAAYDIWGAPQETRDNFFAELVALQSLRTCRKNELERFLSAAPQKWFPSN